MELKVFFTIFAAVFIEHLTYSFLPQHIESIVVDGNLASIYLSLPFIVFYLFFALSLVPAGHIAEKVSPRPLMLGGLVLSAIGLAMLITFWIFPGLVAALSGIPFREVLSTFRDALVTAFATGNQSALPSAGMPCWKCSSQLANSAGGRIRRIRSASAKHGERKSWPDGSTCNGPSTSS